MSESPLKVWVDKDGGLLRLRLARPKANIIDAAMIAALDAAFRDASGAGLRAALIDHEGPHFSFGASVEEHLPRNCAQMIASLHALLVRMIEWPAPILVAVKGQCLGGGLELALAGSRIFASADAQLGQPEIKLAVFAPAASCLLPFRVNQQCAEDLLFSGRSLGAEDALRAGLVASVDEDPVAAALEYYDRYLALGSAASLAYAVRAARVGYTAEVKRRIAEVEKLYLEGLMKTRDANEGLVAFLEKRKPRYEHR
ncbi:MAG: cyclohexa-1,5-dienecarbonyl-CoA hydratase [Betaproteobacteria bacterium]|nr:cyclohexa-1,5-dienecarbonyl-CoA hydratase [Betaproteobacteria bacterium]